MIAECRDLTTIENWEEFATGRSGDIELEKAWLRDAQLAYKKKMPMVIESIYHVFCKKQHDYGPQNIALAGPKGVSLRMVDKFSRLWNLTGLGKDSGESAPANEEEALYDTAMDLADYGIILMMTIDGSWKLLNIKDAFVPLKSDTTTDQPPLPFGDIPESLGEDD